MFVYCFGGGKGHLSVRAEKAAREAGAELINYTDPGCNCGYGCAWECPSNRRHWFEGPNRGYPFDKQLEVAVMTAVHQAATKRDRKLLGE